MAIFQPWSIKMLGEMRAQQGERVLTRFYTRKMRSLLAYLAFYADRAHSREELVAMLWPEADEEAGRMSLRTALSSLRRQLEPPGTPPGSVLQANRTSVQLNPTAVVTDVGEFQAARQAAERASKAPDRATQLERAVALYRGDLLPGLYDEWIFVERQHLKDAYVSALRRLRALWEQEGDLDRALMYARRAVAALPFREEVHQDLIRLSLSAGQPDSARHQYLELERILKELDRSPSSATQALVESLPELAPPQPAFPPSVPAPSVEAFTPPEKDKPAPARWLPVPLTHFFGREPESEQLAELLQRTGRRLVTLTGPAGSGKSRLALEVAARMAPGFEGMVCFVPLADVQNAARLPEAIRDALQLARTPNQDPYAQIVSFLSRQRALLLLDNFEHLIAEGGRTVRSLLEQAPMLTCLVTSRQRLQMEGEQEFPVMPLSVPQQAETPERLLEYAGIQMFVDRAQSSRPDFQLTPRNASAVAALCARLEGLPLAIELAASQAQMFTPAQMLSQLEDRFEFLVSRRQDVRDRHRSLHAAVEWSYRLLSPRLQRFFAQLSVFRGGFTLEAARTVCQEEQAFDFLYLLLSCSLVISEEKSEQVRFRLLETLREFGQEQLSPDERMDLAQRHTDHFLHLAEEIKPHLLGSEPPPWLEKIQADYDNLRAALAWLHSQTATIDTEFQLAKTLLTFWYQRGYLREGQAYFEAILDRLQAAGMVVESIETLFAAGDLALAQGDYDQARDHFLQRQALCEEAGDLQGVAISLCKRGNAASEHGDFATGRTLCEQALALARRLKDRPTLHHVLFMLGNVYYDLQDYAAARASFEEALQIAREVCTELQIAYLFICLGKVACKQGDQTTAYALHRENLTLQRRMQHPFAVVYSLETIADLCLADGQAEQAVHLLGAAAALRAKTSFALALSGRAEYEDIVTRAQTLLGEEVFAAEWNAGRALSIEQAIEVALSLPLGRSPENC